MFTIIIVEVSLVSRIKHTATSQIRQDTSHAQCSAGAEETDISLLQTLAAPLRVQGTTTRLGYRGVTLLKGFAPEERQWSIESGWYNRLALPVGAHNVEAAVSHPARR